MNIGLPTKINHTTIYAEKYNLESFDIQSTRELYANRLTSKLITEDFTSRDVENTWKNLKRCITEAAEESIGKRQVNINTQDNKKPWFTTEVKELAEEKKKIYLEYKSSPSQENHDRYIEVRNSVNSKIRRIKTEYWQRFTSDMDHDLYGAQRKIWKMLKNRKKPVNDFIQTKRISQNEWEEYFRNLYNTEENAEIQEQGEELQVQFQTNEITEGIKKLKNRKAPGTDNIPNELLKYGGGELAKELTTLFNKIIRSTTIPDDWHRSITIPIFKKGQKTNPENYRGISLLCTTMKLFTNLIKSKLAEHIENRDEQQGFRGNRSTTDAIFIVRQLKEKAIEYNKSLYVCFIDMTKAFDNVQLGDVIDILKEKHTPSEIVRIIHRLNTNNMTAIRVNNQTTGDIPTPGGIRQGDSLSPFLFNLIMDNIIEEVTSLHLGYRLRDKCINMVCYADDATIVAETEDDLQRQVYRFYQTAQKYNMKISTEKTKCMTFSKDPLRCKLEVNGNSIEQVMQFKYLGVDISSMNNPAQELKIQINKAAVISGCLRDTVWNNKYMRMDSKVKIYKACVRPTLTYGIETRADTGRTKSMLRTSEMKTLRMITGKTLRDRVRNDETRRICGVGDVVRWGRQRRRYWYDHVKRMNDDRLVRVALEGKPTNRRPPGRPSKRWKDSWQSASQEN